MWFRLARMLGMSVARAKQEISAEEFYWWNVYLSFEPFDKVEADMRHAILCTNLHLIASGKCYTTPRYDSFVVDYRKAHTPESDTPRLLSVARAFVATYNKAREDKNG